MNFVEGLNKRFQVVTSSSTEKDFYLNCFYYFDYIYQNPELLNIYEEAARNYSIKFCEIWGDYNDKRRSYLESGRTIEAPEITTQPDEVARLEKFDMYCNACGLDGRVYHPIKHYQECDCPETCGDFTGSLLINGLEYTLKRYKNDYREPKKKITQIYKSWYEDQSSHYQEELSRFHIEFIEKVSQLSELDVPSTTEIKPFLNLETGDFSYFGRVGNFPTSGQEFKVLKTLLTANNYKASHDILVRSFLPSVEKATKSQKSKLHTIIRNIKIKLGVLPETKVSKPDPFKSVRGEGYRLELPK